MFNKKSGLLMILISILFSHQNFAFCGFFAAKADAELFNNSSRVVIVRDGDMTVLTMENDYLGDTDEFAMVIPVPVIPGEKDIQLGDSKAFDRVDAYSAPRLAEYFDVDPCKPRGYPMSWAPAENVFGAVGGYREIPPKRENHGVKIEAEYTVGEYDILILSAKQSNGLVKWLKENNYKIPQGAERVVRSYLKQSMYFFVAKVNLERKSNVNYAHLNPLRIHYHHPRFMLPIRLGMVNANGPQELFVYLFTKNGRVETTNYRTVKLPTGNQIPVNIKNDFGGFYKDLFHHQYLREKKRAVFLEYAWDISGRLVFNKCDPCVTPPIADEDLKNFGVNWISKDDEYPLFITRLHVRYQQREFPQDLIFYETSNKQNYQARYVIRHPWSGNSKCMAADRYKNFILPQRKHEEISELEFLTGKLYSSDTFNITSKEKKYHVK